MAGKQSGFSGRDFRKNIRFTMTMGAPTGAEDQATFLFANQLVYNDSDAGDFDATGVPFDPSIPVTRHVPTPIKVPCAVEYQSSEGAMTDFGLVSASRAIITLLDEDYQKVKNANAVLLGGERYVYQKTEFPQALFDVGLYYMHFTAENDL